MRVPINFDLARFIEHSKFESRDQKGLVGRFRMSRRVIKACGALELASFRYRGYNIVY